jgi:hypothetical protein
MKTLTVCAALALGGATVPALPAATPDQDAAALRLQDRSPVVVAGTGFQRRERVRVTMTLDTTTERVVRTNRAGRFVVTFVGVTATRCDLVRVVARGGRGSRATLKILPPPACLPQRAP